MKLLVKKSLFTKKMFVVTNNFGFMSEKMSVNVVQPLMINYDSILLKLQNHEGQFFIAELK